jgi:hypothetical protein
MQHGPQDKNNEDNDDDDDTSSAKKKYLHKDHPITSA